MGSIDFKSSRGLGVVLAVSVISGGTTSVATNRLFGPGGGWEDMVKQQAVMTKEMSHITEELREIAKNTKSQTDLAHEHDTSLAELKLRMTVVERGLEELRKKP